ncbi:MAG: DUF1330 domain-containing protein [Verrucomicrobiota bacterium]
MNEKHITRTHETSEQLSARQIDGEVVILSLVRFKKIADYSRHPKLDDGTEITGREAFQKYMEQVLPLLNRSGSMLFSGEGDGFLIGPPNEKWDWAMLFKQHSLSFLMSLEDDPQYRLISGHKEAALEDSRMLPLVEKSEIFPSD